MLPNIEGEMIHVATSLLDVPRSDGPEDFQRPVVSDAKIAEMARDFNWALCGAITVIRYPSGQLVVAEGGHRVEAAKRRGIQALPCIIFRMQSAKEAAEVFRLINSRRSAIHPVFDQKAAVIQGDKTALVVQEILTLIGRKPAQAASGTTVACIRTLQRLAARDERAIRVVAPLLAKMSIGHVYDQRLLSGLWTLERNLHDRKKSIAEYSDRLIALGSAYFALEITKLSLLSATMKKGRNNKSTVWAEMIVAAYNHGTHRHEQLSYSLPKNSLRTRKGHDTRRKTRTVEIASQVGHRSRHGAAPNGYTPEVSPN